MTVGELRERIAHLPKEMTVALMLDTETGYDVDLDVDSHENILWIEET